MLNHNHSPQEQLGCYISIGWKYPEDNTPWVLYVDKLKIWNLERIAFCKRGKNTMTKTLAEYVWEKTEEFRKIPASQNNRCFREVVIEAIEEWFNSEFAFYEKPENSIGILAFLQHEKASAFKVASEMRRELAEYRQIFSLEKSGCEKP